MKISDELRRVHTELYRVRDLKNALDMANTIGLKNEERIERDLHANVVEARYNYLWKQYQELLKVAAEEDETCGR